MSKCEGCKGTGRVPLEDQEGKSMGTTLCVICYGAGELPDVKENESADRE